MLIWQRYSGAVVIFWLLGAPASSLPVECRRVPLDPAPAWSFSAAWNKGGEELAIVDVVGAKLLRYSRQGYFGDVTRPGLGDLEFNHPTELLEAPSGFLLKNPPAKLIWLDRSYRPVKSVDLLKAGSSGAIPGKTTSYGLLGYELLGSDLVGIVIVHQDGRPRLEFARLTIQPLMLSQLLGEVKIGSIEDEISSSGTRMLGSAGGGVYALRYGGPPYLMQLTPALRRLRTFPSDFSILPKFPKGGGPAADTLFYKVIEGSTMATGLYGRGDFLYLLTRKPAAQATLWQLWQIDPKRDVVVRSLTLPTTANHVFLAPGPKDWAVIEKGPVIRSGEQAIKSMLLIPSPWIEDPASKVLTDGQTVSCH